MSEKPIAPDDRVADYRSGELDAREQARFEDDVLERDGLAEELYADLALEAQLTEAGRAQKVVPIRPAGPGLSRLTKWAVPLAVAAGLLIVVAQRADRTDPVDAGFRGANNVPVLVAPADGIVTIGDTLHWRPVEDAESYRIEFSGESGEILWRQVTSDVFIVLRDAELAPGHAFWTVVALDGNGFALGTAQPQRVEIRGGTAR